MMERYKENLFVLNRYQDGCHAYDEGRIIECMIISW